MREQTKGLKRRADGSIAHPDCSHEDLYDSPSLDSPRDVNHGDLHGETRTSPEDMESSCRDFLSALDDAQSLNGSEASRPSIASLRDLNHGDDWLSLNASEASRPSIASRRDVNPGDDWLSLNGSEASRLSIASLGDVNHGDAETSRSPLHPKDMEYMSKPDGPSNQILTMASSSSSSSLAVHGSKKYDVFLSFRGVDTRGIFVSHLYEALVQKGIYTYKDDETLRKGESISPALLTAIEDSSFAVVIFSKHYPNSSWCLDELAKIMECNKEKGLSVLPVFYDVKPSDVRKLKGDFGQAFSPMESDIRAGVWRKALAEAATISGWEPKEISNGNESECIKTIVKEISLGLPSITSDVNEDLVGMESRIQQVISLLELRSGGVRSIGIWGVGGGGKTTVARSVYNKLKISGKFDGCSFVENVRENSSKSGLEKLQEKVLRKVLGDKNMTVGDVEEGKQIIAKRLCCRKVLMILDDVDQSSQLEALAGSHKWFGEGSRIIITTRDKQLLEYYHVNPIYNVNLLENEEAIQLFSRHAFRSNALVTEFEELSLSVVSYAAGLPLALKVLGSFLCGKDKNEWKSALTKLKHILDSNIKEVLKISYDGLDHDEKDIFLDIACFHRGFREEYVMSFLNACGFDACIGVGVLKRKSLITIDADGCFDMHDLIQEMGVSIVQGEYPNNPEKHTRIWEVEKIRQLCTMDAAKENYTTETLRVYGELPVNILNALSNMKNVRMVDFRNYGLTNSDAGPFEGLPNSFQLDRLGCLVLVRTNVTHLWRGYKSLPRLKVIELSGSRHLTSTPDFSGVPNLETLILANCTQLVEIHPSIGSLQKLQHLDLSGCEKLQVFPPIIHMKSLSTLKFDWCEKLAEFPEIQGNMDSLTHLSMVHCYSIEVVPSSLGQYMTNLENLNMSWCTSLKRFEGSLSSLKCLRRLNLIGCSRLARLPSNISQLAALKSLYLSRCNNLQELRMGDLPPSIAILEADGCESLKSIGDPPILMNCERLGYVSLVGCSKLRKNKQSATKVAEKILESTLQSLPRLKVIELSRARHLTSTPDFSGVPNLETLILRECTELVEIHPSIGSLQKLQHLDLTLCEKLQVFPPIIHMKSLTTLNFDFCYSLAKFPEIQGNMDSLTELSMIECYSIEVVPSSLGQYMTNLVSLNMRECSSLKRFEGSLSSLKCLRHLDLEGCSQLTRLPSNISQLVALKSLDLSGCKNLQELPMGDLPPSIAILNVDGCESLKSIGDPPILMNCERLHYVSLVGCSKLTENKQSVTKVAEKILESTLQGNEIAKHGLVMNLPGIIEIPKGFVSSLDLYKDKTYLELPPNWIENYNGFLVTVVLEDDGFGELHCIHIKKTTLPDHRDRPKFDMVRDCAGTRENELYTCLTYIPLGSPKATKWLNSASNTLSFEVADDNLLGIGVKLHEKKSISEPTSETLLTTEAEEDSGFVKCMEFYVEGDELGVVITRP